MKKSAVLNGAHLNGAPLLYAAMCLAGSIISRWPKGGARDPPRFIKYRRGNRFQEMRPFKSEVLENPNQQTAGCLLSFRPFDIVDNSVDSYYFKAVAEAMDTEFR